MKFQNTLCFEIRIRYKHKTNGDAKNMMFDDSSIEISEKLPLLPVRDIVVFPYMILPLFVGRESSIKAVEEALSKNRLIFLASQKDISEEDPLPESIFNVGTVAMITRMRKLADHRIKILVQGLSKGQITSFLRTNPYMEIKVKCLPKDETKMMTNPLETEALIRSLKDALEKLIAHGKMISPDILLVLDDMVDPGRSADLVASHLDLKVSEAQKILEVQNPLQRLKMVVEYLTNELEVIAMQEKIRNTAKDEMSKTQKEYFLREQLRAIKTELGEIDYKGEDIDDLREKIKMANMPEDVEKECFKQLHRLSKTHPDASENSILRTYLDWCIELPWKHETLDNLNLKHAQDILDADHYDIKKVKERILEFLAVRQLKKNMKGPILCFAGPPGVGKTSLGKSIAKAMGRKYARMSLGGVKDEAEIRGHRRTYVGAMPGKIIQALKTAGSKNPVFVLDEIDKLGSDFRGDPSAALLEVLDPEQNHTFRDHYLNVNFDLSKILFLATANVLEDIPRALRDRMEVINLSGYTEQEKLLIAKKHLIKRQLEANGITKKSDVNFTDRGLQTIISSYTREAGLRNLEREIGSICRKIATQIVKGKNRKDYVIEPNNVTDLLGPAKFIRDDMEHEDRIGVATGLAWTPVGGEVLYIETLKMKGRKGKITLTGQLGDVMKESAQAALAYTRANAKILGIPEKWFDEHEIHVHLPAGAIAKDGPSAGITIATAIISLITETNVRSDVAMTGEVSLMGRVLPIGGLKDKALAALRHGSKKVIIPFQNTKDLIDIPKEFRKKIQFIPVKHIDEVLAIALEKKEKPKSKATSLRRKSPKFAPPVAV